MQVSTQLLPVFTLDFFWKVGERKGGAYMEFMSIFLFHPSSTTMFVSIVT